VALIGELSLGGEVRTVPGILPMVAALARRGIRRVVVAHGAVSEAQLVGGIDVIGVDSLTEAVELIRLRRPRRASTSPRRVELGQSTSGDRASPPEPTPPGRRVPDLAEVRGQPEARRALEIALAGRHGLMFVGPPGSGKTLLARTIPGLLPSLDDAAALAATVIASAAADGPILGLRRRPPFRAPHHTISYGAMVGGGPRMSPGEITLADQGVLFLDELPEFDRDVLEALRQPLEEGRVAIARVGRATIFPARFQLVAAMNPCPCGYAGVNDRPCACPTLLPQRYQRRVSGPLRDRIDLWVTMPRVAALSLVSGPEPEDSATVGARIAETRARIAQRGANDDNGRLSGRALRAACRLTVAAERRVVQLAELERASGRGTERILRVGRTIADLAGEDVVREEHLDEAAWFRPADLRLANAEAC
jgi:magnesium chelatase family protein